MPDLSTLPLTSAHWGTYRVRTENGRVQELYGFEADHDVSPIAQGMVDTQDGPTRIDQPMVRKSWLENGRGAKTSARGAEAFIAVSWDEAERLVANELEHVRSEYGNQAIYAGSYGWASAGRFHHAQSQIHRFLNCIGGYTASANTYSFASAEVIVPHVIGDFWGPLSRTTSWPSIIANTELMVAFGGIPLKNGQISPGGVGRHCQSESLKAALQAGIQFVNVSPIRSDLSEIAGAEWLPIRPSTDTALLIGIAHTLMEENLQDTKFLSKYTHGSKEFFAYLSGEHDGTKKSADWAAEICEIPEYKIRELARRMASSRTMISVSWSLTRQDHGEQTYWAAISVAAMLGQIGLPGGGVGFGYSASNNVGDQHTSIPAASLPQGRNPIRDFIPVARISDMLLGPNTTFEYDGIQYLYPEIHLVYWAGGNPFHHHQDLNRLLRAWQKPDTIIVHEWCWNALAKHSDVVLPCTTTLERNDLKISPYDPHIVHMQKVADPANHAKDDYEILKNIAVHMSVESAFTAGRSSDDWIRWIYEESRNSAAEAGISMPEYEDFLNRGWYEVEPPESHTIMLEAFCANPTANPLNTPSGKIEIFSETISGFGYADCPGHPVWLEPVEWLGQERKPYPLHLISNQPATKLHSQLDHGSTSRTAKIEGREPVMMHPADAEERGLRSEDIVRVFNERGSCLAALRISDDVRRQVVQMSTGAWFDPVKPGKPGSMCKHGNPNLLTIDKGTSSLAQGPIAHTCLVEVERFAGAIPPVTAFDPPEIIR